MKELTFAVNELKRNKIILESWGEGGEGMGKANKHPHFFRK